MTDTEIAQPAGYVTLTLHAHLPYVIHHGTWPHGMEWLLEAAAETYLPLLRMFRNLERDGLALAANINLSPILLEQLAHAAFKAEFPRYLDRKIQAAREDEALFSQTGEDVYAETARFWQRFYMQAQENFEALGRDIIGSFRHFEETGQIELMTSAATHGFLPLLGNDECCLAQVKTGLATHQRHLGKQPRGIWIPECGYRPAGPWQQPVASADGAHTPAGDRLGVEEIIARAGLRYFFVDTHLVTPALRWSPYEHQPDARGEMPQESDLGAIYHPHFAGTPQADRSPVAVLARDPQTGLQVWSGEKGYPGDGDYLDFHKKRWPGGHRYWRVTGPNADMALKEPYRPQEAAKRTVAHAEHFAGLLEEVITETLAARTGEAHPPLVCALFDAELFGHWWFEGVLWLEHVVRTLAARNGHVQLIAAGSYLDRYPPTAFIEMAEGSWGKGGTNEVWLNPETAWTWTHIYEAEERVRTIASSGRWKDGGLGERIVKQLCRELLLLESSDWQFLITTEAARDYAEARITTHLDQLKTLESVWQEFTTTAGLSAAAQQRLLAIEERDNIFPEIDPGLWASQTPGA